MEYICAACGTQHRIPGGSRPFLFQCTGSGSGCPSSLVHIDPNIDPGGLTGGGTARPVTPSVLAKPVPTLVRRKVKAPRR